MILFVCGYRYNQSKNIKIVIFLSIIKKRKTLPKIIVNEVSYNYYLTKE